MKKYGLMIMLIILGLTVNAGIFMYSGMNYSERTYDGLHVNTGIIELTDNNDFINVERDGQNYTNEPGKPRLPAVRFIWKGHLDENSIRFSSIVDTIYIGNDTVMPVQYSIPKTGIIPGFAFDRDFYKTGTLYPEKPVNIFYAGMEMGEPVWVIEVFPVQYDMSGRLIVHTEMDIGNIYSAVNAEQDSMPAHYLIVTSADNQASMEAFAQWKMQQGFWVREMIIDSGLANTEIRDSIISIYSTEPDLRFVLLAGDIDIIPHFTGTELNNPPTDLYYSLMDTTDFLPDLYIGRLPGDSADLSAMTSRILEYEKALWSEDDSWTNRAYLMASNDNAYHAIPESTQAYTARKLRSIGMEVDSLWYYYNSGTPVSTAFNAGVSAAFYSGHGTYTSWSGPPLSQAGILALNNGMMYPAVFSFACQTGNYALGYDCFGETWILNRAASFMGSSVYSYWNEDDIMQKGMIDAYADSSFTYLGKFMNAGKMNLYIALSGGGFSKRYYEMYNILGDPSMDMFSKTEGELDITAPPQISDAMSNIDIYVNSFGIPVGNALVSYILNDSVIDAQYTDNYGRCTFGITGSHGDTVHFYATRHNYKPADAQSEIKDMFFYLYPEEILFSEFFSLETPDSMFSAGDSGSIRLKVINFSNDTIVWSYAIIRALTPNVTLSDSIMQIHDTMFTGDTVISDSTLSIYVDGTVEDYEKVTLQVIMRDTIDGKIYERDIYVRAPGMEYSGHDVLYKQEEYILSPDTLSMTLSVKNTGRFSDKGLRFWIEQSDPELTFSQDTFHIDSLGPGDSASTDTFRVYVASGIDSVCFLRFNVHVTDTLGNSFIYGDSLRFGRYDYLVIDYDPDHTSGPQIDSILSTLGYSGTRMTAPSPDILPSYRNIFMTRGIYSTTATLSSSNTIAKTLDSLLVHGNINMYMEGGECWYWDVINGGYDFNSLFGITALSDGLTIGPTGFTGVSGTFTYDQTFTYSGNNAWLDVLTPDTLTGSFDIFRYNGSVFGIAYNEGNYRTVGLSFELAGLDDGAGNSNKTELLSRIMTFFETGADADIMKHSPVFALKSVKPNPFRDNIEIMYTAIPGTDIDISIYDVSGRKVHSFSSTVSHELNTYRWNAAGEGMASGVYFLKIGNGREMHSAKLVLIK